MKVGIKNELTGRILDIGGGGERVIGRAYGAQVTAIDIYLTYAERKIFMIESKGWDWQNVEEIIMRIRQMTIEDYEGVYALWMSCKGMGLNNLDDSEEGIAKFLERNPSTCFVAEDDCIVGVIMAGNDGRRGYIYHTSVNPDYRHQGIGTKLVDASMSALAELGINKAALVVFDRNETGNAFWEKQGFTVRNDLVYRNKALADIVRIDT